MFFSVEKLWPPAHPANEDQPMMQWTDEGLVFYEEHKNDDPPVELTPGVPWTVIEPECNLWCNGYLTYPRDNPSLQTFRHEWVMVRQAQPFVPRPQGTPFP